MKSFLLLVTNLTLFLFPARSSPPPVIRQPLGAISQSEQSLQYIVDQEGQVFNQASVSALPLLLMAQAPHNLDRDDLSSLKILNRLSNLVSTRVVGQIQDGILIIQTPTTQFLFNPSQNSDSWYTSLQQLIARSRIDGKVPHKIDLRFTHPIITY